MESKLFFVFALFVSNTSCSQAISSGFTYGDGGGRLGSSLRLYVKTKWLSYKYGIPLYHKPFKYSDQFVFHHQEERYSEETRSKFKGVVEINNDQDVRIEKSSGLLYEVHKKFKARDWDIHNEIHAFLGLIDDTNFIAQLKKMLQPCVPISKISIPRDRISVAVHVRKGGGYDPPLASMQIYRKKYADRAWPEKFPPDQYYIDQIIRISEMVGNAPLYVHIFTDDPNPKAIADRYKQEVGKDNIVYGCRENENIHNANVIADLFGMAQFDCLIRARSNFSQIAELIGNHKIVIYAKHAMWKGDTLIIDEVGIAKKDLLEKRFSDLDCAC